MTTADHIDVHLSYAYRAFDAHRNMIGVICHPNRHLLPAFKHIALDKKRFELDRPECTIFSPDGLLAKIPDMQMVDPPVKEHIEGNGVVRLVFCKIDVA